MKKRILLVEDDKNIRQSIDDYFSSEEDLELILAADGIEGNELIKAESFDLVLLDVMLPGIDGFSLCRTLRRKSDAPIIFITARGREADVLYGYELGCDDYIVKPFSLAELLAKVKAMLKRARGEVVNNRMLCGDIEIDTSKYVVYVKGEEVELPPKEFEILYYLVQNKNKVCTRESLLVKLWGYDFDGDDRVLDNHIRKLRKVLGTSGSQIKTVITKGYKVVS